MLSTQPVRCRTFVGRRNELAVLDGRRKALAQSSGSFVLVTGEPGIGKTRLLTEFLELTRDRRGRNVVNTECLQRAQQPLGPIRALVSKLANAVTLSEMPSVVLSTRSCRSRPSSSRVRSSRPTQHFRSKKTSCSQL